MTPIHAGMPCDPLTVTDDEHTRCPEPGCNTGRLGSGWLEHHEDGSHTWTPWPVDEPAHHHLRLLAAIAVVLAVAALLAVTR